MLSYQEEQKIWQEKIERQKKVILEIIDYVVAVMGGQKIDENKNIVIMNNDVYKVVLKKEHFNIDIDKDLLGHDLYQYKGHVFKLVRMR